MRHIKKILALAILVSALSPVFAIGSDVVVLMDSSGTILPYFDEINNRILIDITKKFIRQGDVFHLVSFNSRVNLEIVQPIQTEADISRVVSRFMLLYPLGQNSDFLSGLQYTYQYVSSLEQQREKIIIIISDGIFNPPATSPYATFNADQIKGEIALISRKIRGSGWNVYYIKLPFPKNAEIRTLNGDLLSTSTSRSTPATETNAEEKIQYTDVSSEFTNSMDIKGSELPENDVPLTFIDSVFSLPEVTFPDNLGRKGRFFILPLKIKNTSGTRVNLELTGVYIENINVLWKNSFLNLTPNSRGTLRAEINLPETILKGPQSLPIRLQFSDNMRVSPQSANINLIVTSFSPELLFKSGMPIVFTIVLIVIAAVLLVLLFLFIFHRTAQPATDAVRAAEVDSARDAYRKAETSSTPVEKGTLLASSDLPQLSSQQQSSQLLSSRQQTARQETLSNAASYSKAISANSPSANKIDSKHEGTKLPLFGTQATTGTRDITSAQYIRELALQQSSEKNNRLAILSSAAQKAQHHSQLNSGARANEHIEIRKSSTLMLELHVNNQNTHVGKRNIHMMKAGSRLSVGGGSSSFLIFLVKFPSNIAEIRFDGEQCSLAILKPKYFPYETENIIHDFVNRDITIISDKEYEVTFSIRIYEDPVKKLNSLLTSIQY